MFSKTAAFRHDSIPAGIQAIQSLGTQNDFGVVTTEDAAAFNSANLAHFEAVVFLNTTGDVLNAAQQAVFQSYVEAGGGFVGVHSAADTEYDWPWYGQLVGAYFSSHPAIQSATIKVADKVHPSTAGLPDRWMRTDEWYNYRINPRGAVHVLATLDEGTYSGGTMGFDHPIAWCQNIGLGRSWYTGLGHTIATYSEPLYRQHLLGGIQFAAGFTAGDAGATVNANFAKVVLDADTLDPMQLDVAADGRVFYVERAGAVRVWEPATSSSRLIGQIPVVTTSEDGLLGIALDPQFATNQWLYVFYSAVTPDEQHVSRFTVVNGQLDMASERILLRVPVQRTNSNHSGGALGFGPNGLLYVALGDNTSPFASDGFAPIDERPGRSDWDAQKSASNTNDLRGKILRIKPMPDGTYTIPPGNLFPADGSQGRPEIYIMGNRNPFRFSVDSETGWLYWGEVGPDAGGSNPLRGPAGQDEFNQARAAGNFGWPYFVGDNKPYIDYNFATGQSGQPFNSAAPQNNSPNNTGSLNLPAAKPAWIWYPYSASAEFPELGTGGRTAMSGPVYHYQSSLNSARELPAYYDDTLIIYEWSRNWIKEVKLDANGNVLKINPFLPNMTFLRPMDMKIGPDGAIYMLEWGSGFGGGNSDSQLIRIDYRPPLAAPVGLSATVQAPNRVRLTWSDTLSNESGFRIERATDGVTFTTLVGLSANTTSYDDTGLQSFVTYSYRVRALNGQTQSGPSIVSTVKPQLATINGTSGNDTYYVIRTGSQLYIYENIPPVGQPTYSSELSALGPSLTINTLGGDDTVIVNAAAQPLGVSRLIYNAGAGANSLVLESGSARIDSIAIGGTLNSTVQAGAQLSTNQLKQNGLTLTDNSRVTVLAGGATSLITSLNLGPGASLDLTDNALVLDYTGASPVADVRAKILSARGGSGLGKGWNGTGITSTTVAQANQASPESRSLGYAENAILPLGAYTTFRGQAVDATSILIAYTRTGDANLNGVVNDDDVTVLGTKYAPGAANAAWAFGDFEYNGFVDDDDVTLLGTFYNPAASPAPAPAAKDEVLSTKYEGLSTKDTPVATSSADVVARSGDHVTAATEGLLVFAETLETSGQVAVRGQETRAQQQETRAQPAISAEDNDDNLLDLLAESIAADTAQSDSLADPGLASSPRQSLAEALWGEGW